jgi:DNA-directed RNA polymerase I, II, and III subunit RPABC1
MEPQIEYDTEQNRSILLPKLFRVWKTLNQMMADRGYIVEEDFSKITYQEWLQKNNNKATLNGIYYKKSEINPEEVLRLYFEYIGESKLSAKEISIFFSKMKDAKADSGIIVISGQLTSQAKQKMIDINYELQVECFNISELMVNITEHSYVPKHILLTKEEKKMLLKRYKIKEHQLPKILTTDPVAKYLGLKKGDVVKIIRDSETAGKYVTYRITA